MGRLFTRRLLADKPCKEHHPRQYGGGKPDGDDDGVPVDRAEHVVHTAPLTTKSASRAPHSVQRSSLAQSMTDIPAP